MVGGLQAGSFTCVHSTVFQRRIWRTVSHVGIFKIGNIGKLDMCRWQNAKLLAFPAHFRAKLSLWLCFTSLNYQLYLSVRSVYLYSSLDYSSCDVHSSCLSKHSNSLNHNSFAHIVFEHSVIKSSSEAQLE